MLTPRSDFLDFASMPPHFGPPVTERYWRTARGGPQDPTKTRLPVPFVAAITGAGKGVGSSIARAYAQAGASGILLCARTELDLEKVATQIRDINSDCEVVYKMADVTSEAQMSDLATICKQHFGRLDAAVINAGVVSDFVSDKQTKARRFPHGILEDTMPDHSRVWTVNYIGTLISARAFLPLLQETSDGAQAIVFVTSLSSLLSDTDITSASYNISKLAVNSLAEHVHESYKADGVSSFALHPGCIQTYNSDFPSMWDDIFIDDISLPGGFCVWLTKEKREWLSGRFVSANWDVEQLEQQKHDIVDKNKFKSRITV